MVIKLRAEDGSEREISDISEMERQLRKAKALAVRINGRPADLGSLKALSESDTVEPVTFESEAGREIYRHSTSHVMAHAVKTLFPDARVAIGPAIQDGFYYDFDISRAFTPEDLASIEKEMERIIKKDSPFVRKEISKEEAIALFETMGEVYKVELIREIPDATVS